LPKLRKLSLAGILFILLNSLLSATAFYAARALEILAILATTAAIIVVCMKIFFKKENNRLLYIAAPISIFASKAICESDTVKFMFKKVSKI
jgi:predicted membrane channel-forming protein YqfA (hemolysin III family)